MSGVEGCRARTQCEERCEDGEHMSSPLHYRLPDTTQQHQTHHGYSYPSSSHLSSHWFRALQPPTAPTHCLTASYPLQHFYNILQSTTSTPPLCLEHLISTSNMHFAHLLPVAALFHAGGLTAYCTAPYRVWGWVVRYAASRGTAASAVLRGGAKDLRFTIYLRCERV